MIFCMVDERTMSNKRSSWADNVSIVADSTIQNVWKSWRDLVENGGVDPKVLSQDVLWGMSNPVVNHESCSGILSTDLILNNWQHGLSLTYPWASKLPSSKTRRYSFASSWPWTVCATPGGKYHTSPASSVSTWYWPFWSTADKSRDPL